MSQVVGELNKKVKISEASNVKTHSIWLMEMISAVSRFEVSYSILPPEILLLVNLRNFEVCHASSNVIFAKF